MKKLIHKEFIKRCAEHEGWFNLEWDDGRWYGNHKDKITCVVPTYTTETDLLRVVRLLDEDTKLEYYAQIASLALASVDGSAKTPSENVIRMIMTVVDMDAPQIAKALAAAWGFELAEALTIIVG